MILNLPDIWKRIEGNSEDMRFEAWMELYHFDGEEARQEIQKIISSNYSLHKILFARFLSHVHEERAVSCLCDLLMDDNETVVLAAKKAFEKNAYEFKVRKLYPVIHAPVFSAKSYAIEKLAVAGEIDVLDSLIQMLDTENEKLLFTVLSALRYLPDSTLLRVVERFIHHENEEVRFKAVLIYGSLFEAQYSQAWKFLIEFLNDESAHIRQAALWSLRIVKTRKNLCYFLHYSKEDPDPMVRQEALLGLAQFPTKSVIRHLISILVHDQNRLVVLKGEAVLLTMPVSRLIRALRSILKDPDQKVYDKAVLLFAEFQKESSRFFRYLVKSLKNCKSDKEMLPFIEAIGIMKQKKGISILEKYLNRSPLLTYAALSAILKIWGKSEEFPVLDYLQRDNLNVLNKQIVIKHFIKIDSVQMYTQEVVDEFVRILRHENLNLRYLAAQALAKVPRDNIVEPLIQMMMREIDPASLKLLRENIGLILQNHPGIFPKMFHKFQNEAQVMEIFFTYMKDIPLSREQILKLLSDFFLNSHAYLMSNYQEKFIDVIFYYLLTKKINFTDLFPVLESFDQKNSILHLILHKMKRRQGFRADLPVPMILEWMQTDVFSKELLIELLGYSDSLDVIPALVSLVSREDKAYHPFISKSLNQAMRVSL